MLKEQANKLVHNGRPMKHAIYLMAGHMPGNLNVLLVEAEVPYEQVFQMADISSYSAGPTLY